MTTTEQAGNWREIFGARALRTGLLVLVMAVVATGCQQLDRDRTDAVRLYNDALVDFESGATGSAIESLEEALEADPTFYHAAYTLGQIQHVQLNNPEDAVDNYRRALDQEPDNPRFNYRVAVALADSGEHEEALDYYREAISLDSEDARYWFQKGLSQDAVGEYVDAIDSYTKAIELQPRLRMAADDPGGEHYFSLGDLYYRFRLYHEASQVFENGAENNRDSARLQHGLGLAAMELDRYHEAVEAFEAALERDPEHQAANFSLAEAYHKSGDIDRAMEQLEILVQPGARGLDEAQQRAARQMLNELQAEEEEEEEE